MKNSIRGWKDIFSFTFIQGIKAKSIVISTIIMCIIAMVVVPVISFLDNGDSAATDIKEVEILDMTGLDMTKDFEVLKFEKSDDGTENIYSEIEYKVFDSKSIEFSENTKLKDIYKFEQDSHKVYIQISYIENSFELEIIYDGNSEISSSDVEEYNLFLENNFSKIIMSNMKIESKDMEIVNSVNNINYCDIKSVENSAENRSNVDNGTEPDKKDSLSEKENIEDSRYNILYFMMMFSMLMLSFGGERIAMSIVTEKSSKVMEYLMTSIKPMAIVVGKILANLLLLVVQIGAVIAAFLVSLIINLMITGEKLPSYITDIFNRSNFVRINVLSVLIAIILLISGFIFFSLIAALAGASVSKIEEMSEGMKLYVFVLIIGAYIAIFVLTGGAYKSASAIKYATMLVPLTSVFLAPASMLTGYLSLGAGILSLAIMLASIILLVKFVSNVYESMIYYNGTHLKFKDIVNISKQNKKGSQRRAK